MDAPFSSPGMIALTISVLSILALSLLLLWLNVYLFQVQAKKYKSMLHGLGNEKLFEKTGRVLVPLYITGTVISTMIILYLFIFQPHLL